MSAETNNDVSINENDKSTSSKTQAKKKERRQKSKDTTSVQNESAESVKSDENAGENAEAGTSAGPSSTITLDPNLDAQLKTLLDEAMKSKGNANLLPMLRETPKTQQEAMQKPYKFWSTQPVPKFDEVVEQNEAIEPNKEKSELRADPYALPDGFKWDTMTLDDPLVLKELYTLLNENYVEDDDAMFRFDYQPEFLKWALQPPGWRHGELHHEFYHIRQWVYRFFP